MSAIYNNGDILLCSGTSAISEQIKKFTNSIYSHVGLIFNCNVNGQRETFVIEAIQPVIAVIPIGQYFSNYKQSGKPYAGKLYLGRYKGGLEFNQVDKIFKSAFNCVGMGYDSVSIIKQAFNKIFGADLHDKDNHRLICSELVGNAYSSAGIKLPVDKHGFFTPASIGNSADLVICELK